MFTQCIGYKGVQALHARPGQRVTPEIQAESMLDLTAVMVHSKAESKQCYQCNAKSFEVLISLDLQLERSTILTIDIYRLDRKSTRLNSSHVKRSRMPSSA